MFAYLVGLLLAGSIADKIPGSKVSRCTLAAGAKKLKVTRALNQ